MFNKKKPLRIGVIAYIQDRDKNILISQNFDYGEHDWTFPGGGVDKGETAEQAIVRELDEELSMKANDLTIKAKAKSPLVYEFSKRYINSSTHVIVRNYRGQTKTQFHILFTGDKSKLVVDTNELRKVKWVKIAELNKYLKFNNQLEQTLKVFEELGIATS